MGADRLLKVEEVATRLRAHPETVRRWLRDGRLRGLRLGGAKLGYRIAETEMERFSIDRAFGLCGRSAGLTMPEALDVDIAADGDQR